MRTNLIFIMIFILVSILLYGSSKSDSLKFLVDTYYVEAPSAFNTFCHAYTSQCMSTSNVEKIHLTPEDCILLDKINRKINLKIRPEEEPKGVDVWNLDVDHGDCDEYAVAKRKELLVLGWPSSVLSLTIAKIKNEYHLVLIIRTDEGDLVLDNLSNSIKTVDKVHYTWIARQSSIHPRLWVSIKH